MKNLAIHSKIVLRICAIEKMQKAVAFIFLNGSFLEICKNKRNCENGAELRIFTSCKQW